MSQLLFKEDESFLLHLIEVLCNCSAEVLTQEKGQKSRTDRGVRAAPHLPSSPQLHCRRTSKRLPLQIKCHRKMIQVNFVVCYSFFRPVQSNIFPTTKSTRSFSRIISSIIIVSPVMGSFLNHIKLLHYGIGTNTASRLILLFRKCSKSKAKCPKSAYKKYNPKKKWSTGCSPALGTEGMRLSS